jgi:hypothetical protein
LGQFRRGSEFDAKAGSTTLVNCDGAITQSGKTALDALWQFEIGYPALEKTHGFFER